jgi:5-hydroxyisourate hydrolase
MSPKLSTHVLDLSQGRPAQGLVIELWQLSGTRHQMIQTATNRDGRTDEPLLEGKAMVPGPYEILFHVGDYFIGLGTMRRENLFLDVVPVRFHLVDALGSYHVPLLVTPWAYSTYRGS